MPNFQKKRTFLPLMYTLQNGQTHSNNWPAKFNMRNIFLEKSYLKCGRETIPRPFSKKLKLSISLDQ